MAHFHARLVSAATALAVSISVSSAIAASYVFTTIDYPGSVFTDVRGINNNGQIVGYASLDNVVYFGFVYSGGVFNRMPPSAPGEQPTGHGINDAGVIVGTVTLADGHNRGLIYDASGYRFFSRPGSDNTYFRAVDVSGRVTGYSESFDAAGIWLGGTGFILDPAAGVYTDITVPDAMLVIAQGINTAGTVVGSGQNRPGGSVAFIRDPSGAQTYFQVAGMSTKARGINNAGLITGGVEDGTGGLFTFVGTPPNQQNIAIDGMPITGGEGINDNGQVVGLFIDPAGNTHGFLATPVELPASMSGGSFMFSLPVEAYTPIYIDPQVALGYEYATGRGDLAFATVRLPIGIGDSRYTLIVNGHSFALAGGELFDFRAHGYPNGVNKFRVTDIEMDAALDPVNPHAFPTELTFTASGTFTGTMTPLCLPGPIPPQAGQALRRALGRCVH
ncbi:MAG TPA: hypothetical protein VFE23_17405 [Usitatibacter sp.]|jgi:probable HAF family extracellular repeat protein|nr:hypothetical protein [Usitatibacter sp.]